MARIQIESEYWSAALRSGALSAGALVGAALYKLSWSTTRSGAPKKAGALVGAQLALQRSDKRIIHAKNWKKIRASREFSKDRKTKYFSSITYRRFLCIHVARIWEGDRYVVSMIWLRRWGIYSHGFWEWRGAPEKFTKLLLDKTLLAFAFWYIKIWYSERVFLKWG